MLTNVSASDFATGNFPNPGPGAIAIQITDPCAAPPATPHPFAERHHFEFCDVETDTEPCGEFAITEDQAASIARILHTAQSRGVNVIVHCHQGIYRSGAIATAGQPAGRVNLRVHRMVSDSLASM